MGDQRASQSHSQLMSSWGLRGRSTGGQAGLPGNSLTDRCFYFEWEAVGGNWHVVITFTLFITEERSNTRVCRVENKCKMS